MKILYLHQYYRKMEQGGPVRSAYLANALVEAGHEVVMLTSHNGPKKVEQLPEGYTVVYLPVAYDNTYGLLRRLFAWYSYISKGMQMVESFGRFDLVYASSTPLTVGYFALHIKRKHRIPYIFELRDVWPEVPYLAGYLNSFWLYKIISNWAAKLYSESLGLVVLSPRSEEYLRSVYPDIPMYVTPNMSDVEYYQPKLLKEIDSTIRLVYLGSFGKSSGLTGLLKKIDELHHNGLNVELHLAGKGYFEHLVLSRSKSSKHIYYYGELDRAESKALLDRSHVGLVWFEDKEAFGWNSPNKFFDYIGGGLPVWCNIPNAWYTQQAQAYGCALAEFELYKLPGNGAMYRSMQMAARKLASEAFDRSKLCSNWINQIEGWARAYTSNQETVS